MSGRENMLEKKLRNQKNEGKDLLEKIKNKSAKVVVIGLGYIGLPKAAIIASVGFHVKGVDVDNKIVRAVNTGKISTNEPKLADLIMNATKRRLLCATIDVDIATKESDVIVICVQTPISKDKTPNLSFILKACEAVGSNLSCGKLIIFESTLPPSTTKTIITPLLEKKSGLICGRDFWIALCPERIMPGKAIDEFENNPRIVGGFDDKSTKIAAEFLKTFTKGNNILTDATTAEVAKLAENTYRDVNIAFANQLALICEKIGADVMKTIELANTHPRVHIHLPGPGVGGSCLPKDPYLLLSSTEPVKYNVIKTARQINDYMPHHVVGLIFQALRDTGKQIKNSKIALLGVAYKCDVDDSRFSPSKIIIDELTGRSREVIVYDPVCSETFGAKKGASLDQTIEGSDCVVILTDHADFNNLDLLKIKKFMKAKPSIVDGKRVIDHEEAEKHGFYYLGVGLGAQHAP
jgi:UDP-N-acetyl-D-mannosaminuronic acid dehydrogenase